MKTKLRFAALGLVSLVMAGCSSMRVERTPLESSAAGGRQRFLVRSVEAQPQLGIDLETFISSKLWDEAGVFSVGYVGYAKEHEKNKVDEVMKDQSLDAVITVRPLSASAGLAAFEIEVTDGMQNTVWKGRAQTSDKEIDSAPGDLASELTHRLIDDGVIASRGRRKPSGPHSQDYTPYYSR